MPVHLRRLDRDEPRRGLRHQPLEALAVVQAALDLPAMPDFLLEAEVPEENHQQHHGRPGRDPQADAPYHAALEARPVLHRDPPLLDLALLVRGDQVQGLVEDAEQLGPVLAHAEVQRVLLRRGGRGHLEVDQVQLPDPVRGRRQVGHHGVHPAAGQRQQALLQRAEQHGLDRAVLPQEALVRRAALDPDAQRFEVLQPGQERHVEPGHDHALEADVGLGEPEPLLALQGPANAGEHVDRPAPGAGHGRRPGQALDHAQVQAQPLVEQAHVVRRDPLVLAPRPAELERVEFRIDPDADHRMPAQPVLLLVRQRRLPVRGSGGRLAVRRPVEMRIHGAVIERLRVGLERAQPRVERGLQARAPRRALGEGKAQLRRAEQHRRARDVVLLLEVRAEDVVHHARVRLATAHRLEDVPVGFIFHVVRVNVELREQFRQAARAARVHAALHQGDPPVRQVQERLHDHVRPRVDHRPADQRRLLGEIELLLALRRQGHVRHEVDLPGRQPVQTFLPRALAILDRPALLARHVFQECGEKAADAAVGQRVDLGQVLVGADADRLAPQRRRQAQRDQPQRRKHQAAPPGA